MTSKEELAALRTEQVDEKFALLDVMTVRRCGFIKIEIDDTSLYTRYEILRIDLKN